MSPEAVRIPYRGTYLQGDFCAVEGADAVVVFAHGAGSSRFSPRNRAVAERLRREGFATLLLDLLTNEEEAADQRTGQLRFDVELLATRLISATAWLTGPAAHGLPLGYFGASTGTAAAIVAAARQGEKISAIVSRGGRPDLAIGAHEPLRALRAPTLLIVGSLDKTVLALNRQAASQMTCEHDLVVVPGASHLFEEPGALARVAELAAAWFHRYLQAPAPR
ncbi:MAG: dienelactone hydrolase family protein [Acidimicrobiales bacterium]